MSSKNSFSLGVFCSASKDVPQKYFDRTNQFGKLVAEKQMDLIYGGAQIGLMGELANACLDADGYVCGVIPGFIKDRELGHEGVQELILVDTMHKRKEVIYERSDAIAVLPGGLGTLDEAFEFMTWNQLALHNKKIAFLNWDGFFEPIKHFCERAQEEKFLKVYDNFEPKFFEDDESFFDWLK